LASRKNSTPLRAGTVRVKVFNSGLEVWMYDEANREAIRASGGMNVGVDGTGATFESLTQKGLVVGFGLYQDDEIDMAVIVGEPLTDEERRHARWLEPQQALLICRRESSASSRTTRAGSGQRRQRKKGPGSQCRPGAIA
jgi:hypothetical protein